MTAARIFVGLRRVPLLGLLCVAATGAAQQPPRTIGAAPAPCVQVDIAGHKAGALDCAAQKLDAAAKAAQRRARDLPAPAAPDARSADVVTGVASQTATRQRMGNPFGTGVRPQRPAAPAYSSPRAPKP